MTERRDRCEHPADDECHAAKWRDHTQLSNTSEGQAVKAPREENNPNKEKPDLLNSFRQPACSEH